MRRQPLVRAMPPLRLPGTPVVGPAGVRDNVARLLEAMGALLPPGWGVVPELRHQAGCPAPDRRGTPAGCTCVDVDLTLYIRGERRL